MMKKWSRVFLLLLVLTCFSCATISNGESVNGLAKGNWAPENRARLQKLIDDNANQGKYVVFDWDFTCIFQDTQESLFRYQIKNLLFRMTPAQFARAIRIDVPKDNFDSEYSNMDGQPINIEKIAYDLEKDYKFLYESYKGMKGNKSLSEIQKTEEFVDFQGKLAFLYEAIGGSFSADIAYPWVLYLFEGMTHSELEKITVAANDAALKEEIGRYTLTSSSKLKGKAGQVSYEYKRGLRTQPETAALIKAFRTNGIEVFVCSASLEDVVRVFASNPKYGYNVKPENVIGMRLEKDGKDRYIANYKKGYPQTQQSGKTKAIKSEIAVKYNGAGPIFVACDSQGDYNMATDFKETQLVLVMNRVRKQKDKIYSLCKIAVAEKGKIDARAILQGRDENKGVFIPYQGSYRYGKKDLEVLRK